MYPRQRLRLSALPDLYEFGRKRSVAATTTFEITDEMIGLKPDALAQEIAERFVRAAIAYWTHQSERHASPRRTFTPIVVRIATIADEEPDNVMLPDVVETLTPDRTEFDG